MRLPWLDSFFPQLFHQFSDICKKIAALKEYTLSQVNQLTKEIFIGMGCSPKHAEQITTILLRADLRGIKTHGLMRLKEYYRLVKLGKIQPKAMMEVVHETPSTALLDAGKGFGMVAGEIAMTLAMEKAATAGTGWVAVRNSNHFGIAGAYALMATQKDMIGITMTNANPLVAPTYSKKPLLGTNPMAFAIPAGKHPAFLADFATAPIARGKLDVMHLLGKAAPEGLVQDADGNATTNANILTEGGAIRTLGGEVEKGGHKGYCLSAVADIFSAVLSGANFGPTVVPTLGYLTEDNASQKDMGIGHFFGAMRVDAFQKKEEFLSQMEHWVEEFRSAQAIEGQEKVLIPGDPERAFEEDYLKSDRIPLMDSVVEEVTRIKNELNVSRAFE